jgi:hypothetical protein
MDDLTPEALGLRAGATTADEAKAILMQRGLTGITESRYGSDRGSTLELLGADYQSRVHVFRNGRYDQSLMLPTGGVLPYGLALAAASDDGGNDVVLALYRDPLAQGAQPPQLLSYRVVGDRYQLVARMTFERLVRKHDGMTRPMLVGSDLNAGVMLVARDADGDLWDTSYLVRFEGDRLALKAKSMVEALRCSCVRDYAFNTAAR